MTDTSDAEIQGHFPGTLYQNFQKFRSSSARAPPACFPKSSQSLPNVFPNASQSLSKVFPKSSQSLTYAQTESTPVPHTGFRHRFRRRPLPIENFFCPNCQIFFAKDDRDESGEGLIDWIQSTFRKFHKRIQHPIAGDISNGEAETTPLLKAAPGMQLSVA